jgi:uncharacterized protein YkwD
MKRLLLGFILGLAALPLTVGASGLWVGYPTKTTSHFYVAWTHHQWCGKPVDTEWRNPIGGYVQTFKHCQMTEARVHVQKRPGYVRPTVTPRPTRTPLPTSAPMPPTPAPIVRPTATAPTVVPTATAVPTPSIPTAQPTATSAPVPSTDPVAYELSLLNATRAQFGATPLSLNSTQSAGTTTCAGSYGHSLAMAQSGQIWHQNASYPSASFPTNLCVGYRTAGENVGEGGVFGDPRPMLQQLHASMMAEGTSNCGSVVNHACNIVNPAFQQVGIGLVVQNGAVWLTTDFLGN